MNTKKIHQHLAALAALGLLASATIHAADVKQTRTANSGESWATAAIWDNNAAASSTNDYFTNGCQLRSPQSTGSVTFTGKSLTINGGAGGTRGTLHLKSVTTVIDTLSMGAGTLNNSAANGSGQNTTATVNIANLTILSDTTSSDAAIVVGSATNQDMVLNVTNLKGSGYLKFDKGNNVVRNHTLTIANATAFTGTLNLAAGSSAANRNTLTIAGNIDMSGGIFSMANTGTSLVLNGNLIVSSFTFGSVTLTAAEVGTGMDATALNTRFGAGIFSGGGKLIYASAVPEPATISLLLAGLALGVGFAIKRRNV